MAANDNRSRIDQVFADPRWAEEALTAAAVNAIDQHRRAGVPLVVDRDGRRIEHVPAERLAPDVEALLQDVDFETERTVAELIAWLKKRLVAIRSCLMANEPALHSGKFKRFYEELYPFALWLGHVYASREDLTCSLNSGGTHDSDYDAVVKDRATDPPTVTYVQLTTTTFDRDESLRMKRFLTDEVVSSYGPPAELEWLAQEEMSRAAFEKIARAVERKATFPFGPNHVLVVCFDDFMWFGTDDDRAALRAFVNERLAGWGLNVATLYIVGISGRTFESFSVPPRA